MARTPGLRKGPGGGRVHRARFLIAYAVLAAVVGVAAGALVLVLQAPADRAEAAWSPWQPTGDERDYPEQIASHVSSKYELPSGDPLVNVIAQVPQLQVQGQNVPISWVAVEGSEQILSTQGSYMYILCGRGQRCSVREGRPTPERLRALKRQALELALYTFKYVGGVDSVVALLPTARNGNPTGALFYREENLEQQLDQPLGATLPNPERAKPPRVAPAEVLKVERLTTPFLFNYAVQQAQDGSAVLVLTPVPAD
jgi:hypothetical protein